jgi:tetratricopeptide (TPR) repeat protein
MPEPEPEPCTIWAVGGDCRLQVVWDKRQFDHMDESRQAYELFLEGRLAHERGDYHCAVAIFRQSLEIAVHFKTLELLGESLCRLGKHQESIVPLAAATGLNRGSRSPCLLAESFAALHDWQSAQDAANESLLRTPGYGRAKSLLAEVEKQLAKRIT